MLKNIQIPMKEKDDKRRHERLAVPEGTFAVLKSDSVIVGQIINISSGGLAFCYVANGLRIAGTFLVDIFLREKDFYLKKIPFEIVSDYYLENEIPFSTMKIRRCSGRFGNLAKNQATLLESFLQTQSNPKAAD